MVCEFSKKKFTHVKVVAWLLRHITCQEARICVYIKGLQGTDFSVLARPKVKIKISARARLGENEVQKFVPSPARTIFFSDFGLVSSGLSDFKTGLISCLHIINIFFW